MDASSKSDVPDGYAVLLKDKASAPKGYWYVGLFHDKDTAEDMANKVGKDTEVKAVKFI